jgi:hypothetical protein
VNWLSKVFVTLHRQEFELVDNSMFVMLLPGINEMKNPVV